MSRNILVAGNCQIGGIAAALKWIFPSDKVSVIPFNPHVFKGDGGALANQLASADIVFGGDFVQAFLRRQQAFPSNFVTIPSLYFSAFHPDIVAAKIKSTGARLPTRYNSIICLWAYANGLDPADAALLFTHNNFGKLGYYQHWDASVTRMEAAFESCGQEFSRFFMAVKRSGIFMYTVNHPRISLLTWMAKLLAIRVGHDKTLLSKDISVNDALGNVEIWPVYPDVAHQLAVPGSYTWLVDRGRVIDGLQDFIEYSYAKYSQTGIQPDDIAMVGVDQRHIHTVLSAALKGE
jgi:hypothetical protein